MSRTSLAFTKFSICFNLLLSLIALFAIFFICQPIQAATLDITWETPADTSQIAGYKIYWKQSGDSYSNEAVKVINAPSQNSCSVVGLKGKTIYGFVATSFDENGNESSYSNEVFATTSSNKPNKDSEGVGLTDGMKNDISIKKPNNVSMNSANLDDKVEMNYWGPSWGYDSDNDGFLDSFETYHDTDPADPMDHPKLMETGEASINHTWKKISLDHQFADPVVVAKSMSTKEDQATVVRIRNVLSNSFEICIQGLNYQGSSQAKENVSYLVMEAGDFQLPDGTQVEAKTFSARESLSVNFHKSFSSAPFLIATVTTDNNPAAIQGQLFAIDSKGFSCRIQNNEIQDQKNIQESVSYIAWEASI